MNNVQLVDEIFEDFDFGCVHRYMDACNWTWDSCGGVPTEHQLKARARQQLYRVLDEDLDFSSTGGFCVAKRCGQLSLAFQIEERFVDLDDDKDDDTAPLHGLYDKFYSKPPEPPKTPPRANKPYSGPSYRVTVDPDGAVVVEIAENKDFSSWRRYHLVEIQ